MALTESTMMPLGAPAPSFVLPDAEGNRVDSRQWDGRPWLVMFICNHCPYVQHVAPELSRLAADYADTILAIVAIQSNDTEAYPDDAPELMRQEILKQGYPFPYLYDHSQQVARAFTAACTPDFFLFDSSHHLVYRGRLDASRPVRIRSGVYDSTENRPDGNELRAALDAVLANRQPDPEGQLPSIGCNIKWKPGQEPDYVQR